MTPPDDGFAPLGSPFGHNAEPPPPRVPPHNFEIEMGLLAALLANNRAFEIVGELLQPVHFADARHGKIYDAIAKIVARGGQANAATLRSYFDKDGELEDLGGTAYLARLQASAVSIVNTRDYAARLFDLWQRRELIDYARDVTERAYAFDVDSDAGAVLEAAESNLFAISEQGTADVRPVSLEDAGTKMLDLYAAAHKKGGALGIQTGLAEIDRMVGGLEGGSLTILGARPSMGKTALAVTISARVAHAGRRILFFQLEMTDAQIARRMVAMHAGIDVSEIKRARLDGRPFEMMVQAQRELAALPVDIVDRPRLLASHMRSIARRAKRRRGLDLIVVDHLTLMGEPAEWSKQGPTYAVGRNSGALKELAKELDVPILCLCQLNRANEAREEKRPQLSDLRWSGEIEQDADTVMFVHRESYYLERAKPARKSGESIDAFTAREAAWRDALDAAEGKAEIIFAKQRDGAVGIVELGFDGPTTRFFDLGDHLPAHLTSGQGALGFDGGTP